MVPCNKEGVLGRNSLVAIVCEETFKGISAGIQPVNATVGGNPLNVFLFLYDVADYIVADTLDIAGIRFIDFKLPAVVYIQSIPGAKP